MNRPVLHEATKSRLTKLMTNPPQALLLAGPKGIGTSTAATFIAAMLSSQVEKIVPKKRSGNQFVEDWEGGSIVIEDIRNLYGRTRSKFTEPRVFVLDFGDRTMTHGAQNAFLKLLEEPQSNVYFILATHHPELLLPTIASRCQRVDMRPITLQQTNELLSLLRVEDPVKRSRIHYIAEGLPAEIARLAEDENYYDQRVSAVQDAKAALEGDSYQRVLIIRKYKDQRSQTLQFIDDMLLQLEKALERSPDEQILRQINKLIGAYDKIQQNGNVQLQLARVLL